MAKKRSKLAVSDAADKFSRLFWAAREEQSQLKEKATKADPAFKSAVEYAKFQGWDWAEGLSEVSRLERLGEHEKALSLLTECEPSVPSQRHGLVHFLRGATLNAKGEHDEAIKAYRKALDDTKFDKPAYAWFRAIGLSCHPRKAHCSAAPRR